MNEDSGSKLAATQSVLRKKFEKAYTIRIENENDVDSAMKPLTSKPTLTTTTTSAQITNDLESKNNDFSLQNISKTTNNSTQLHLASKSHFDDAIKTNEAKQHDPNTLCAILRLLLASSSTNALDLKCMQAINTILDELRKLDIM